MDLCYLAATGNRFALADGFRSDWPGDPAAAARELCASHRLDGLLLVGPSLRGARCVMQVWNADGGRAEMCGNGLRCVGRFMVERGHVAESELTIETDAGLRAVHVMRRPTGEWSARAELGIPRLAPVHLELEQLGLPRSLEGVEVDLGNPHCVLFVPDTRDAPVARIGEALQHSPRFPAGVNVGFAQPDGHQLELRVFERGVGETASCGSGACAAAAAAISQGRVRSPVEVHQPGGWLLVEWEPGGSLWLTGSVEALAVGSAGAGL